MAPAGVSEETGSYPLSHLKIVDRAMQFPVVSDTVGEVSKYADTIRNNGTVQSATHAVQAGFKTFTDLKPVVAMKDAVMKSTISDMVLPRMAGAVESLDSLACGGLDQLKAAVPAIAEPTPQLVQSTKRAASGYWDSALQYLSSFTVSQVSLGLADKSLDMVSTVVGKVVPTGVMVPSGTAGAGTTDTKTTLVDRLQEGIGGVRETVQNLKKRGEPLASDISKNLGLLTAHLFTVLRLPAALLGLFGLRLETQEKSKGVEVAVKGGSSETKKASEVSVQGKQQTGKRSAENESSDED